MHAARFQFAIPVVQAQLRTPGDRSDGGRLLLFTLLQRHRDARREAVVPSRLDQYSPYVSVAGFGDRSEPALVTAGVLGRHEPQVTHQLARMCKALEFSELC